MCSKKPLLNDKAIAAYRKAIEGTTIYRNAEDYAMALLIDSYHGFCLMNTYQKQKFIGLKSSLSLLLLLLLPCSVGIPIGSSLCTL